MKTFVRTMIVAGCFALVADQTASSAFGFGFNVCIGFSVKCSCSCDGCGCGCGPVGPQCCYPPCANPAPCGMAPYGGGGGGYEGYNVGYSGYEGGYAPGPQMMPAPAQAVQYQPTYSNPSGYMPVGYYAPAPAYWYGR